MHIGTLLVFDEIISGAGPWYTGTEFDRQIGLADRFAVQAVTTGVSGSAPTITVDVEHSPDSEHWLDTGTAVIPASGIDEDESNVGNQSPVPAPNVRFKITLGGTSPKCRLRLYVALRAFSVPYS